jgi:DNA-binding NtrC family response regulator
MRYQLGGKRVLIVEDEFLIALHLTSELAARGAIVVGPTDDVDSALKAIENTSLDGAILNVDLRGEPSFRVADALAGRHIPFVFATGYETREMPTRHSNVPHFEKPVRASLFAARWKRRCWALRRLSGSCDCASARGVTLKLSCALLPMVRASPQQGRLFHAHQA